MQQTESIHTIFVFSYVYIPKIKFNLIKHSKRLTTDNKTIITIYSNKKLHECGFHLSKITYRYTYLLHLNYALITHCGSDFPVSGKTAKFSKNSFSLLHNFTDRRFISTVDLSNLSWQLFLVYCCSHLFTHMLSTGISEWSASLLLHFGAIIK